MKHRNKLARLQGRIDNWEKNPVITKANQQSPGAFKKPGSNNK
jgi:hypothetical protein